MSRPRVLIATVAAVMLALTACASAGAPRTAGAPSTPPPLRTVDLAGARVSIPSGWHVAKYQGELATVIFPLLYISDRPLVGPCLSEPRSPGECTTNYWFPPRSTTPDDGVLMLWQEWQFPSPYDRFSGLPGRSARVDGRQAKLYAGPVVDGGCPADSATQVSAGVRISDDPAFDGELYYAVACLGPHVSATDRHAVTAMIRSLRIERR